MSIYGIFRASVIDVNDPIGQWRLKVQVPEVLGEEVIWANACVPAGRRSKPKVGQTVWVQFEGGDPKRPVWIGLLP